MRKRRRPRLHAPEALGGVLARAGDDRFAPTRAPIAPHTWAAAVGARIAERTRPLVLEDGVLVVRAATSAWASELSLLSDDLLARIRAQGVKGVRAMRFRVGQIDPPDRAAFIRRTRVPEPVALDPVLSRVIARIDDNDLREAITRAASANLAWLAFNDEAAARAVANAAPRAARAPRAAETESDPPGRAVHTSRGAARGTRGDE